MVNFLALLSAEAKRTLADDLWKQIKHGDDEHREWLLQALHDYFDGNPVLKPPLPPQLRVAAQPLVAEGTLTSPFKHASRAGR